MSKIIHQAWFGPLEMPKEFKQYSQMWQDMNPDWDYKLWSEADVEEMGLQNREIWDHIKIHGANTAIAHKPEAAKATQMADVAGYEIIHRFGGVYLNCDMLPLRPLSALPVKEHEAWAVQEINQYINNGCLGGPVLHPFWQFVIDELPIRFRAMPDDAMHLVSGPHLLTKIASEHEGLKVLPKHLFNNTLYDQIALNSDPLVFKQAAYDAGAIALHTWGHRRKDMRTDVR